MTTSERKTSVVTILPGEGSFSIGQAHIPEPSTIERQWQKKSEMTVNVRDSLLPVAHRPEHVNEDIGDSVRLAQGAQYEVSDFDEIFVSLCQDATDGLRCRSELLQGHKGRLQALKDVALAYERHTADEQRDKLADDLTRQANEHLGVFHHNATDTLARMGFSQEAYEAARQRLEQIVEIVGTSESQGLLNEYRAACTHYRGALGKLTYHHYLRDNPEELRKFVASNPDFNLTLALEQAEEEVRWARNKYNTTVSERIHREVLEPLLTDIGGDNRGAYTDGTRAMVDGFRTGGTEPDNSAYARLELLLADHFWPTIQREVEAVNRGNHSIESSAVQDSSKVVTGTVVDETAPVPATINPVEMEEFLVGISVLAEFRRKILDREEANGLYQHLTDGQVVQHASFAETVNIQGETQEKRARIGEDEDRRKAAIVIATTQHTEALHAAAQALDRALQDIEAINELARGAEISLNAKSSAVAFMRQSRETERRNERAHAIRMGYVDDSDASIPEELREKIIGAMQRGHMEEVEALMKLKNAREAYWQRQADEAKRREIQDALDRRDEEEIAHRLGKLLKCREELVQALKRAEGIGVEELAAADAYIAGMIALYDGLPPVPPYVKAIREQEQDEPKGNSTAVGVGKLVASSVISIQSLLERHSTIITQAIN